MNPTWKRPWWPLNWPFSKCSSWGIFLSHQTLGFTSYCNVASSCGLFLTIETRSVQVFCPSFVCLANSVCQLLTGRSHRSPQTSPVQRRNLSAKRPGQQASDCFLNEGDAAGALINSWLGALI